MLENLNPLNWYVAVVLGAMQLELYRLQVVQCERCVLQLLGYVVAASADVSRPSLGAKRCDSLACKESARFIVGMLSVCSTLNSVRDRSRRGPLGFSTNPLHVEHLFKVRTTHARALL